MDNKLQKVTSKGSDLVISPLGEERRSGGRGRGDALSPTETRISEKRSVRLRVRVPRTPAERRSSSSEKWRPREARGSPDCREAAGGGRGDSERNLPAAASAQSGLRLLQLKASTFQAPADGAGSKTMTP